MTLEDVFAALAAGVGPALAPLGLACVWHESPSGAMQALQSAGKGLVVVSPGGGEAVGNTHGSVVELEVQVTLALPVGLRKGGEAPLREFLAKWTRVVSLFRAVHLVAPGGGKHPFIQDNRGASLRYLGEDWVLGEEPEVMPIRIRMGRFAVRVCWPAGGAVDVEVGL